MLVGRVRQRALKRSGVERKNELVRAGRRWCDEAQCCNESGTEISRAPFPFHRRARERATTWTSTTTTTTARRVVVTTPYDCEPNQLARLPNFFSIKDAGARIRWLVAEFCVFTTQCVRIYVICVSVCLCGVDFRFRRTTTTTKLATIPN